MNVPVIGGVDAEAGVGPLIVPRFKVVPKPGNSDPVQVTAPAELADNVGRGLPTPPQVGVGAPKTHVLPGEIIVTDVTGYALLDGFVTVTVIVAGDPPKTSGGLGENPGELAFCTAKTGAASGTRTSIPENASNASIVPELNFVKYAFEGVFILFST